jgi:hypothetical protein
LFLGVSVARTPGSAIIAMNTNAIIRAETVKIKVLREIQQ